MKTLAKHWRALAATAATAVSTWFLLDPGPYAMAAFVFLAQPVFGIVMLSYAAEVWRDLRRREVL